VVGIGAPIVVDDLPPFQGWPIGPLGSCFAGAKAGTCGSATSVAEHEFSSTLEVG
jgi:hypothetical protein